MLRFLIRTLSLNWIRTLSIFSAFFLSTFLLFFFLFALENIESGVQYYTLQGINEKRVTLTKSSSLFDLLDRSAWGIDQITLSRIQSDPSIESYKILRFIDVPVLGTFHIFQFWLSIDVPVFSVENSSGKITGIGISTSMLNYYNLELAWSYPLFPVFQERDLIGKMVSLEFGASKLFTLSWAYTDRYESSIERIDPDYPWFGIVIDNDIAKEKFKKLHKILPHPYRIVMQYRDIPERNTIETRYPWMILNFDSDTLREKEKTFSTLRTLMGIFVGVILLILYGFLLLLFLGYFREKSDMYMLIRQFKVGLFSEILLLWGEIGIILFLSTLMTLIILPIIEYLLLLSSQRFLMAHQIFFPMITLSSWDILLLSIGNMFILFVLLLIIFLLRRSRRYHD